MAQQDADTYLRLTSESPKAQKDVPQEVPEDVETRTPIRVRRHSTEGRFASSFGEQRSLKKVSSPTRKNKSDETSLYYTGPLIPSDMQAAENDGESSVYANNQEESVQPAVNSVPERTSQEITKTFSDRIKLGIEDYVDQRVLWWPFSEPSRDIDIQRDFHQSREEQEDTLSRHDETREAVEVSSDQGIRRRVNTTNPATHAGSSTTQSGNLSPIPPPTTSNQPASSSTGVSSGVAPGLHPPTTQGPQNPTIVNVQAGSQDQYVYFCVNAGKDQVQVFEIDITRMNEDRFISKLIEIYYRTARWQSIWAMTDLGHVEFRRFKRASDKFDGVSVEECCVPAQNDPEWSACESGNRRAAEELVSHYLRPETKRNRMKWLHSRFSSSSNRQRCQDTFLQDIPTKNPNRMDRAKFTQGYGILAGPALSLWRILFSYGVLLCFGLWYMIYKLCKDFSSFSDAITPVGVFIAAMAVHWSIVHGLGTLGGPRIY